MKKLALLATLALVLVPVVANAEEGPLLVRLRGVYVSPANKSDAFGAVPADAITVGSKTIPEVDISYFFTKNFSAELILTYPQKLNVSLLGNDIGSFKALPPTLTAQWHFLPDGVFNPYVGVGVNLTLISGVDLLGGALDLSSSSFGLAGQVGFDVKVADRIFLNGDVKYVQVRADVKDAANGSKITTVKVDPWLIGAGIGYRF